MAASLRGRPGDTKDGEHGHVLEEQGQLPDARGARRPLRVAGRAEAGQGRLGGGPRDGEEGRAVRPAAHRLRPPALAPDGPRLPLPPPPGQDRQPLGRRHRPSRLQLPLRLPGLPRLRHVHARGPRHAGRAGPPRPADPRARRGLRRQLAALLPAARPRRGRDRARAPPRSARSGPERARGRHRRLPGRLERGERRVRHVPVHDGDGRDPLAVRGGARTARDPRGTGPHRRGEGTSPLLPRPARPARPHPLRDRGEGGGHPPPRPA